MINAKSVSKKITVNDKLLNKIEAIVAAQSSISNVKEFQEYEDRYILFNERPEKWTDLENAIYEHTERVRSEIMKGIKDLLLNGNSR